MTGMVVCTADVGGAEWTLLTTTVRIAMTIYHRTTLGDVIFVANFGLNTLAQIALDSGDAHVGFAESRTLTTELGIVHSPLPLDTLCHSKR